MEHPTHHHEARMVSASGEDANTKPRPEAEATPTKEQLLATQAEQTQRLQQLQAEFTAATEAGDTDKLRTIAAQAQELQAHLQAHQTAIERINPRNNSKPKPKPTLLPLPTTSRTKDLTKQTFKPAWESWKFTTTKPPTKP